jgi:copper chaperone CopZ
MVDKILCDHCGAECKRPVIKVIDGRSLTFCCSGCLQVYELLREDEPATGPGRPAAQELDGERRPLARSEAGAAKSAKTVRLPIVGMTCANCVKQVERGLRLVPGVIEASVSLPDERATVHFDAQKTTVDAMAEAVRRVGYDVGLDGVTEAADGIA